MRSALFLCAVLGGCVGGDVVVTDNIDSNLTVINASDFALTEIYVIHIDAVTWGPNRISGDVLLPDEEITLTSIPCDTYDVRLVAEDGLSCELHDLDLCFDDAAWLITNDTCDTFLQKAAQKAAEAAAATGS